MGILFPEINPNIHNSGPVVVWKYFIYIYSSIHSMTLKNYSTRIWGAEKRTAIVVTIVKVVNIIRQNLQWQNVHFYDMTFERRGNAVLMHTIFCNNFAITPGPVNTLLYAAWNWRPLSAVAHSMNELFSVKF